jgi:hypothetical protein
VKLLRPATGALELFCPELFTALLLGPDFAGGVCAIAAVDASNAAPIKRALNRIITSPPELVFVDADNMHLWT